MALMTCYHPLAAVAPARERGLKYDLECPEVMSEIVAPARERGLKCNIYGERYEKPGVAPARERGLKWFTLAQLIRCYRSLPQGSVD